jgi:ribosomal-protein-alanine N-acetyltransferase
VKPLIHIRWMIRRDMADVLNIEQETFEFSWSEEDFIRSLRQRNCIGMVADCEDKVVGFTIYELHKNKLRVLNFAVDPYCRRRGVGSRLISKLTDKLTPQRRNKVVLEVREKNLDAQLFLRSQGFKAVSVLHDFYDDTDEDAYVFQYHVGQSAKSIVDAASEVH